MKYFLIFIIPFVAQAFTRKQEQFQTTPSYFVLPAPFQIPGIGNGWILFTGINNFMLDYMDVFAYGFTGDIKGEGFGIRDLHLIPEHLMIKGGIQNVREASLLTSESRGMRGKEVNFLHGKKIREKHAGAELTFWNRRFNFYYDYFQQSYSSDGLVDEEANVVMEFGSSEKVGEEYTRAGFLFDFTNDFQDPTVGLRLGMSLTVPTTDHVLSDSKYEVVNQSYNLYLPIGKYSTMVLHYFKSDAYVKKQGTTDEDKVDKLLDFRPCTGSSNQKKKCREWQDVIRDRVIEQNKWGAAATLGGMDRLRGYPMNRFVGAHTRFYGAEFRWNLDDSLVPFDLFLIRDTRSAFQIAFFYEAGSTSDDEHDLSNQLKESKGIGLRVVAKSGYVFRCDYGESEEGNEVTLLGSYPW